MERLYVCLLLLLCNLPVYSQLIFSQLPYDLQLFPRNADNQAEVVISGQLTVPNYTKISAQVLRDGALTRVVSQTLPAGASNPAFRLSMTIRAEAAEYSFRVFLHQGSDSTIVAERNRVVCGDAYIIHGQSNALALASMHTYGVTAEDRFLRNCAYADNVQTISWYPAQEPFGSIGGFGLTLQRLIMRTYGIPTVVINGAVGGKGIIDLSARDPSNPANPVTFYGQLLRRAQWAGVAKQAKGFIWKQGEEDAGNDPSIYESRFRTLYSQIREDYGNIRLYVGQINILPNAIRDGAAAMRDFQRRTRQLFPNTEAIATVGTPDYDGIHYGPDAHRQLAYEQFRQIARDVYGSTDTLQINSPDIKRVFYNARKDSITLEFDPGMQMVWKADTTTYDFSNGALIKTRYQKDYFYIDEQAGFVNGGRADGNRIVLGLTRPVTARLLRYLPSHYKNLPLSEYYDGPTLRNTRGMRAFSFDGVPIADAIPAVTNLAARPLSENQIQLTWTIPAGAETQFLERAIGTPTNFTLIATLTNRPTGTFTDTNLPDPFGTYFYRLRSSSPVSESTYGNVVSARPLILAVEPATTLVRVYPNPVRADQLLRIEAEQLSITSVTLYNALGQVVTAWQGAARNEIGLSLPHLKAGLYTADLRTADGQVLHRKVLVQ